MEEDDRIANHVTVGTYIAQGPVPGQRFCELYSAGYKQFM